MSLLTGHLWFLTPRADRYLHSLTHRLKGSASHHPQVYLNPKNAFQKRPSVQVDYSERVSRSGVIGRRTARCGLPIPKLHISSVSSTSASCDHLYAPQRHIDTRPQSHNGIIRDVFRVLRQLGGHEARWIEEVNARSRGDHQACPKRAVQTHTQARPSRCASQG